MNPATAEKKPTDIQKSKINKVEKSKLRIVSSNELIIDKEAVMKRVMGDEDFLRELFREFLNILPHMKIRIRNAIKENDAMKVAKEARLLGGMAENLGVIGLADYAYLLEQIGRNGSVSKADETFNLLSDEIHRFISYFKCLERV